MATLSGVWPTTPSTPNPPALLTSAMTSRQWLNAKSGKSMPRRSQSLDCMPVVSSGQGWMGWNSVRQDATGSEDAARNSNTSDVKFLVLK